jgi:hypothetical protein
MKKIPQELCSDIVPPTLHELQADALFTLDRLREEVNIAMEHWTIFESANGYPTEGRRGSLFTKVNSHNEAWGIIKIRQLAVNDTILALSRLTDHYDTRRAADRRSLGRVEYFLKSRGCEAFLASEATWADGKRLVSDLFPKVLSRLKSGQNPSSRDVVWLRKLLRELRNSNLAHAIDRGGGDLPNLYDIRDGIVLTADLVRNLSLLIGGLNWDPRIVWRISFCKANRFWDRYEQGFQISLPPLHPQPLHPLELPHIPSHQRQPL